MFDNIASHDHPLYIKRIIYRRWGAQGSQQNPSLFSEAKAWLKDRNIQYHKLGQDPEEKSHSRHVAIALYGDTVIKFINEEDILAFTLMFGELLQDPRKQLCSLVIKK